MPRFGCSRAGRRGKGQGASFGVGLLLRACISEGGEGEAGALDLQQARPAQVRAEAPGIGQLGHQEHQETEVQIRSRQRLLIYMTTIM